MTDTDPMREAQWRSPATWKCPISTVADLIGNLQTIDQSMEVRGAYFVEGVSDRARARGLSLSRERVSNGRIRSGDDSVPYSLVIWTAPDEAVLAAQPPAPLRGREEIARIVFKTLVHSDNDWMDDFYADDRAACLAAADAIRALAPAPTVTQHERGTARMAFPITDVMVDAALTAWFASPPSETDQGLERSMRAALTAASTVTPTAPVADRAAIVEECARVAWAEMERQTGIVEAVTNDKALSDTGRADLQALAMEASKIAHRIAFSIRALADAKGDGR